MGCPDWHTAMHNLRLQRLLRIYCPGHAGVSGNERADRLASTPGALEQERSANGQRRNLCNCYCILPFSRNEQITMCHCFCTLPFSRNEQMCVTAIVPYLSVETSKYVSLLLNIFQSKQINLCHCFCTLPFRGNEQVCVTAFVPYLSGEMNKSVSLLLYLTCRPKQISLCLSFCALCQSFSFFFQATHILFSRSPKLSSRP